MANQGHSKSAWLIFALVVVAAALLVFFFAWLPRQKREERIQREAKQRTDSRPIINVAKVRRAPAASELMLPGTSLAYTEAYIYARAAGYVSRRLVDIGDRVRAGQLLATIDAPDLDKQVAQGRSNLQQSESNLIQLEAQLHLQALNWDRYKVLVSKGVFSRQQGDQQEADYRVAEANVQAARNTIQGNRDNLDRLIVLQSYERVTAPFTGLITARDVDVGTLISATGSGLGVPQQPNSSQSAAPLTGGAQGGEMFGIADISRLRILVSTPEAYSSAIRLGGRAQLHFQELPEQKFEGRVTRTSASIDQNTRTLLVELQVANPRAQLLPGMYVVVNFIGVQSDLPILIPGESIVVRNGIQNVALVNGDSKIQFCPVSIGRDYGDQVEILGGLKEGDVLVTTVTDEVRDGVEIRPQYAKSSSQPPAGQPSANGQGGQYGDQGQVSNAQKAGQQSGSKKK